MGRYAKVKRAGRTYLAHRVVWERTHGPIPDGYVVHHKDSNPRNNEPANLELLTHAAHSRLHNDKHPRVKTCEACGKEYEPSPTKRARSKTCSWLCRNELIRRVATERRFGQHFAP
jgi:HNH endonuclease